HTHTSHNSQCIQLQSDFKSINIYSQSQIYKPSFCFCFCFFFFFLIIKIVHNISNEQNSKKKKRKNQNGCKFLLRPLTLAKNPTKSCLYGKNDLFLSSVVVVVVLSLFLPFNISPPPPPPPPLSSSLFELKTTSFFSFSATASTFPARFDPPSFLIGATNTNPSFPTLPLRLRMSRSFHRFDDPVDPLFFPRPLLPSSPPPPETAPFLGFQTQNDPCVRPSSSSDSEESQDDDAAVAVVSRSSSTISFLSGCLVRRVVLSLSSFVAASFEGASRSRVRSKRG
ncbi:hypothetical protein TorRG33x02_335600, partial [Trema orientale]